MGYFRIIMIIKATNGIGIISIIIINVFVNWYYNWKYYAKIAKFRYQIGRFISTLGRLTRITLYFQTKWCCDRDPRAIYLALLLKVFFEGHWKHNMRNLTIHLTMQLYSLSLSEQLIYSVGPLYLSMNSRRLCKNRLLMISLTQMPLHNNPVIVPVVNTKASVGHTSVEALIPHHF